MIATPYLQALGIPFHAVSVSEASAVYRRVIEENHQKGIDRIFDDVKDQLSFHQHHEGMVEPDLGITGSPCNPFSTQRAKRWVEGNVANHISFETTMSSVVQFYESLQPKMGITEQVSGFDQPFSATDRRTPKQMLLVEQTNHFPFGLHSFGVINCFWISIPENSP